MGASALARITQQLEQIAHSGKVTGAQALLQQLRSYCQGLRAQLQIRRSLLGTPFR